MAEMPAVETLDELTALARRHPRLFVRWSRGPAADSAGTSSDDLTGESLPGLSANPLAVEPWWGDRPLRLWIARRLFDYSHLKHEKGPGVRPWVMEGRELARGPDNEPLVGCDRPVAWIDDRVIQRGGTHHRRAQYAVGSAASAGDRTPGIARWPQTSGPCRTAQRSRGRRRAA